MPKKTPDYENWISDALQAHNSRNNRKIKPLAREFHVPYHLLLARLKGRTTKTASYEAYKALSIIQQKVLISWIDSLYKAYTYPTPDLIKKTVN